MYGERHIEGFGGETEGKVPLGRPRHRLEDNIKMHFEKAECGDGLDQGDRHL